MNLSNPTFRDYFPDPNKKIYYLASPYSTPVLPGKDKDQTKLDRHHMIQQIGTDLMNKGYTLFEPIATSHYKAINWNLPGTYEFWQARDRHLIERTDGVIVADMEGWQESVGVTDEIKYCKELGKPVYLYNSDNKTFKKI